MKNCISFFVLTYFESMIKPYDKLILNDTEYQIYPVKN